MTGAAATAGAPAAAGAGRRVSPTAAATGCFEGKGGHLFCQIVALAIRTIRPVAPYYKGFKLFAAGVADKIK
jgi:hypothetical protein